MQIVPEASAHQAHDPFEELAVSPNYLNDRTILGCTEYLSVSIGVHACMMSVDGGATWRVLKGLPNVPTKSIAFSPTYQADHIIYTAGPGGLFRSLDSGSTWTLIGDSTIGLNLKLVAVSPRFSIDKTMFVVTDNHRIFRSPSRGNTWVEVTVPGGIVSAIAMSPSFPSDFTLVAGSEDGRIFRSTDAGASWSQASTPITGFKITSVRYSPAFTTDGTMIVSTDGAGVMKSTNQGLNWQLSNTGLPALSLQSAAFSPGFALDHAIFVSLTNDGVCRSSNSGASWGSCTVVDRQLSSQTTVHYRDLAVAQSGPASLHIFVGMFEGMWRSIDNGQNWQYLSTIHTGLVRNLSLSPGYATDQTIAASTYGGGSLWSVNGGQVWGFRNVGLVNPYPDALAFSPSFPQDGVLFAGTVVGLQKFVNTSWELPTTLGAPTFVRALDPSPSFLTDSTLFIGTDNRDTGYPATVIYQGNPVPNQGLFISHDAGATWEPTPLAGPPINSIAVSPAFDTDNTVFAGSSVSGLYKSTNRGLNWVQVPLPISETQVLKVAVSPAYGTDATLFVTTGVSGVLKSTDGGLSWNVLPQSVGLSALDLALSPNYAADQTLFLGTLQGGLIRSVDGGNTLQTTPLAASFPAEISVSPNYSIDGTVVVAAYEGIFITTNGGDAWSNQDEPHRIEQDREGSVHYDNSGWQQRYNASASSRSIALTGTQGAQASITFAGTGFQLRGPKGPTLGQLGIVLDGQFLGNANQGAAQNLPQQVLFEAGGLTCDIHTLVVTSNLSVAVAIDTLDYRQSGCSAN